jgi:glycosyltransferase involved in cell wall biosynthesis
MNQHPSHPRPTRPNSLDPAIDGCDISVVLCAYTESRWDDLCHAVQSLQTQTLHGCEVVLVVDHNKALFERCCATFDQTANLRILESNEPKGLSGARNCGIAHATGSIIAFIDEDAVAAPDWLERIKACYADANVMGVGGAISPMWVVTQPRWFPEEFLWVVGCTYLGMPTTREQVRNLIGCNMSFRREVFNAIGGFRIGVGRVDTNPLGCEETELCIRAHQHWPDKTLVYDPSIRVQDHRIPVSRARWQYFVARCYAEGLSKAYIVCYVGYKDGLSSERRYVIQTLPAGFVRGLAEVFRGDMSGVARSSAIVVGLLTTVFGYMVGRVRHLILPASQAAKPEYEGEPTPSAPTIMKSQARKA